MTSVLDQLLDELYQITGVNLRSYRRSSLERRFAARMAKLGIDDPETYLGVFRNDPSEPGRVVDSLVVPFSAFFRDPIVFEILAQSILPEIIRRKAAAGSNEIRIWCAGCARGEEAYSIAILVHEALKDDLTKWTPYIFATDVSEEALQEARAGIYPRERFENVKLKVLDNYLSRQGLSYEVIPGIKSLVNFSYDDLLSADRIVPPDSIFGAFDLVMCRNLLIYLRKEEQDRILLKLLGALSKNGYLVLGSSESLAESLRERFVTLDQRNRIYMKAA
jgi:chemotaxis methyl-accepting protein methylase